jgi:hypothetical protein
MRDANSIQWKRLSVEATAIVASILLAFAIDAWWDERELREQEIAQLYALHADFTENVKRLQDVIDWQEVVVASQTRLLGIIHGHQDMPNEEALKKLVTDSFMFYRLEEVLGAYQALVSSGDLRMIRDRKLRAAIAEFAGTLGDGYEDEELGLRLRVRLLSEMSSSTEILAVLEPSFRADGSLPDSAYDPDFNALLDNRDYRNHLAILTYIENGQLYFYLGLLDSAKTIVGIVEQNL